MAHQHIAAGMKIELSKNNDHYGASNGLKCSKEGDRIPPLKSYGHSLNRNAVSLVSFVTAVIHLPISWISSMADWFQVPAVSTVTGKKM